MYKYIFKFLVLHMYVSKKFYDPVVLYQSQEYKIVSTSFFCYYMYFIYLKLSEK